MMIISSLNALSYGLGFILVITTLSNQVNTETVHFQSESITPEYFSEVCELLLGIVDFLLPLC